MAYRYAGEVERDEVEVGFAGEEVGDGQGVGGGAAADPDEVFEVGGGQRAGIKLIGGVDEGDAGGKGAGGGEELREEKMAAAAGGGADQLGERVAWQAAGGVVDRGDAGGQHAAGGTPGLREARGQHLAEIGEFGGGSGHIRRGMKAGSLRPEEAGRDLKPET